MQPIATLFFYHKCRHQLWIHKAIVGQCDNKIHDQKLDKRIKTDVNLFFTITKSTYSIQNFKLRKATQKQNEKQHLRASCDNNYGQMWEASWPNMVNALDSLVTGYMSVLCSSVQVGFILYSHSASLNPRV